MTEQSLHIVNRGGFKAHGADLERGEVVDTSTWRNTKPLVSQRRISAAPHDILDTLVECPCGRGWIDQFYADMHVCPNRESNVD